MGGRGSNADPSDRHRLAFRPGCKVKRMPRLGELALHGSATRHKTNIKSRPPVEAGQARYLNGEEVGKRRNMVFGIA